MAAWAQWLTALSLDPFVNAACAGEYATHAPQFFRSQIKAALVGGQVCLLALVYSCII
jgi:hypothetical protein